MDIVCICIMKNGVMEIVDRLSSIDREHYEFIINEGTIHHKLSGEPMYTSIGSEGAKWIFFMSTSKKLYPGEVKFVSLACPVQKKKVCFHNSSFLAGGTTLAAGGHVAENEELKSISAHSGHYCPTDENLNSFKDFLSENGVNLDEVQMHSSTDDYDINGDSKLVHGTIGVSVANIGATRLDPFLECTLATEIHNLVYTKSMD